MAQNNTPPYFHRSFSSLFLCMYVIGTRPINNNVVSHIIVVMSDFILLFKILNFNTMRKKRKKHNKDAFSKIISMLKVVKDLFEIIVCLCE